MNLEYKLIYHRSAIKFLAKQEKTVQQRISISLRGLKRIPPIGDIKPMKGYNKLYRLRVGTFRILFEIKHSEKSIFIRAIDSRGGIY